MNPIPALQSVLWGVRDWARAAPRLLAVGAPAIAVAILICAAAAKALPVLADRLATSSPALQAIVLFLAAVFLCALLFSALSWVWLAADRVFFNSRQWIDSPLASLAPAMICALPVAGVGFITWLALIAVGPRLGGPAELDPALLWPPAQMIRAYALVLGGVLVVFAPLLLRIYYAPAAAAVETGEARAAWETLMRTTKGKTLALILATLPQLALLGAVALAVRAALAEPGPASLALLAAAGVGISLLSALQVIVVRHFIGISAGGTEAAEQDFVVEEPAPDPNAKAIDAPDSPLVSEAERKDDLPELPEALRPKPAPQAKAETPAPSLAELVAQKPEEVPSAEPAQPQAEGGDDDFFAGLAGDAEGEGSAEEDAGLDDPFADAPSPAAAQPEDDAGLGELMAGAGEEPKPQRASLGELLGNDEEPPAPPAAPQAPAPAGGSAPKPPAAAEEGAPEPAAPAPKGAPEPPRLAGWGDEEE